MIASPDRTPLPRGFFDRPVLEVAPDLLGRILVRSTPDGPIEVRLTEVEAYDGANDPGSHAYRGMTRRNTVMFGPAGHLYCYFTYGMHVCCNVVCGEAGRASAVLLRAGEIVDGVDLAWRRREAVGVVDSERQLARGPARLAVALGLDMRANGADVSEAGGEIVLHRQQVVSLPTHKSGPRVGVSGSGGEGNRFPWRYWLTDERTVSAYRPAYRPPTSVDAP